MNSSPLGAWAAHRSFIFEIVRFRRAPVDHHHHHLAHTSFIVQLLYETVYAVKNRTRWSCNDSISLHIHAFRSLTRISGRRFSASFTLEWFRDKCLVHTHTHRALKDHFKRRSRVNYRTDTDLNHRYRSMKRCYIHRF